MSIPRADEERRLGTTSVTVTAMGLGCAPLGNLFRSVADADVRATVDVAWDAGIRLFDTAPLYGSGLSELRLGAALAGRDEAVVASKVGRILGDDLEPDDIFVDVPRRGARFDFSGDGVRQSLGSTFERLGRDRLDICWVHDPDDHEDEATRVALPAMRELVDEGLVGAVGVGMNQAEMPTRFVRAGLVDAVLIAGRWSLLDHGAGIELLPACRERDVGVVVGGVFGSGVLADPFAASATYRYEPAPPPILQRARVLHEACEHHGVPLLAAAVQFPFLHPAVTAVVVGARSAEETADNLDALHTPVPEALWETLVARRLLPEWLLS